MKPSEIYYEAVKVLPPEDIDHHGLGHGLDDLYLRVSEKSTKLVTQLEPDILLDKFRDQNGVAWYDLPFCYPVVNKNV